MTIRATSRLLRRRKTLAGEGTAQPGGGACAGAGSARDAANAVQPKQRRAHHRRHVEGLRARGRDGRADAGLDTPQEAPVPGADQPPAEHDLDEHVALLAPLVFRCAAEGDAVAQGILDRQADEVVALVVSAARRLHLVRRDVEVVLGGGLIRAGDGSFLGRIQAGIRSAVPAARTKPLDVPPVVGAALLGLDRIGGVSSAAGAGAGAAARLRRTLTSKRLSATQEA